jgi:hypothetical protein
LGLYPDKVFQQISDMGCHRLWAKSPVKSMLAQMAKRVCHSLELTAFLRDGDVPFHEVLEFGVEDEGRVFLLPMNEPS